MTYRFTSATLRELAEGADYYEERETGLGAEFLDEVDDAIQRILAAPHAWRPLSRRTRRCRTHRFPFGVAYQVRVDEILALSLMDLRRDPENWQTLL